MLEIFLDKLPFVLIVAVIVLVVFVVFPSAFFLCFVVPFLIIKTGYHAFVKHIHEHNLWWDMLLVLIILLFVFLIILLLYGFRF